MFARVPSHNHKHTSFYLLKPIKESTLADLIISLKYLANIHIFMKRHLNKSYSLTYHFISKFSHDEAKTLNSSGTKQIIQGKEIKLDQNSN